MKFSALFSALSLIASVTALPITFNRRSALPFVGGVNLAVSQYSKCATSLWHTDTHDACANGYRVATSA